MPERIVTLDMKTMPVFERHPRIFDEWERLEQGETLRIINDHDPKPLKYQFEAEHKDLYAWEYVSQCPGEWVVNIKKIKQPEASGEELRKKIEAALDEVRPYLQADGGDVELVDVDEASKLVTVKLTGACGSCPSAQMTLKAGVEKTVKKYAHEIKEVIAV